MSTRAAIRTFRRTDGDTLRRLVAEMQDFERAIDPRLLEGSEMSWAYTDAMLAHCAAHAGAILLAELAGEVVGFVSVQTAVPSEELDQPPGSYALVSDLAVGSEYRRRGIGRALLRAAEDYARGHGAQELRIAVLAGNRSAAQLYRSAGFNPYLEILAKSLTPTDAPPPGNG